MSKSTASLPYFPLPPAAYTPQYMHEVIRAFSVYLQQQQTPGPLRATSVTITDDTGAVDYGAMAWNSTAGTLDLTMGNDITQQVGMESYILAENNTGSDIPNGSVVGFSGVGADIRVAPYIADGSVPELYFVGVTTSELPVGATRPITVFGKVRGLDTSGFSVGDILYASPATAGAFTNVRPTAPNAVISVAAVLVSDATDGEIMVRPTIPLGLDYGAFSDTTTQTPAVSNTAQAITLDTTNSANGISVASSSQITVSQAGFYTITAAYQLQSSSSSSKDVYFWLAKNGAAMTNTTRVYTIASNNDYKPVTISYPISLAAGDYVELMWAASDTTVSLAALSGLAFAPDAPSTVVTVTQVQL